MKTWQRYGAGLAALAGLWAQAGAQSFPGAPFVPTAPPAAAAAAAAAPASPAAAPANFWSFFCLSQDQKKACKQCLCNSQFGLLLNNTLAPLNLFSGGIVPPLCPGLPTPAELADQGPVGAAAAIKADTAGAAARIAAVKYLATVSCHYWPEAQDALIGALRKDKNECVRWQAAIALGSGCCCTKATIKALAIAASGSNEDKQVSELSPRVRAAAEASLYHCLDCFTETVPVPEKKKGGGVEKPPEGILPPTPTPPTPEGRPAAQQAVPSAAVPGLLSATNDVRWVAFWQQVDQQPAAEVAAEARRVLAHTNKAPTTASTIPPGSHGLIDIISYAAETTPRPAPMVASAPARVAAPTGMALMTSPPKDPEPPTDLYHVLMGQRNSRPEPKMTVNASLGNPKPIIVEYPASTKVPAPMPPSLAMSATSTSTMKPTSGPSVRPASATTPARPASTSTYPMASMASAKAAPAVMPSAQELLRTLRESPNPFQKETAVDKLAVVGWPASGEVIAALVRCARTDPAATVRVHCIRALTIRNVRTPEVLKTIKDLKADRDPRVQHEAEMALARLGSSPTASTAPTLMRPTAGSYPGRSN